MVACPQCSVGVLFTSQARVAAIVEVAASVLHVVDRPLTLPFEPAAGSRIAIGEENQRINGL